MRKKTCGISNRIARGATAFAALAAVIPAYGQASIEKASNIQKWKTCSIEVAGNTMKCEDTVFTSKDGVLNIHFDTDDTFKKGVTFGLREDQEESSELKTIGVALRFNGVHSFRSPGTCNIEKSRISCKTDDKTFVAEAKN